MAHNISKKINGITPSYKGVEVFRNEAYQSLYNLGGYSNQFPIPFTSGVADITNTRIKFYPFVIYSKTLVKNIVFEQKGLAPTIANNLVTFGLYDTLNNKPNTKLWNSAEYNETTLYTGSSVISIPYNTVIDKGVYFFAGQSSIGAASIIKCALDRNFPIIGLNDIVGGFSAGYTLTNTYSNTLPSNVSGGSFVNSTDNNQFMYIQEN